jgi:hypothetical protein
MFNICMILNRLVPYRIIFYLDSGRICMPQSKQIQEESVLVIQPEISEKPIIVYGHILYLFLNCYC